MGVFAPEAPLCLTTVKRKKFAKKRKEKYFKGKVVIFTVQSSIPYQYSIDLLKKSTVLELENYGEIRACWRHVSKQFCPGAEHFKVKKPVYVRDMKIHLHSTAIMYILLKFPLHCE